MGWRRRVDRPHGEVLATLRELGWACADTSRLPNWVDIVAHRAGVIRLVEVKADTGKLTASQQRLIDAGFPVVVIRNAAEAAALR